MDNKKIQSTSEAIKYEGENLMKLLNSNLVDEVKKEKIEKSEKRIAELVKQALQEPESVRVVGNPRVIVDFPDLQKVEGQISIKDKVTAIVSNFPDIFKVSGLVKAVVDFPAIQKITGHVKADVEFPDTQKVKILNFEEFEKIINSGSIKISNLPVSRGTELGKNKANPTEYIPVRLTDGKVFYTAISQSVQSQGRVASKLEDVIIRLDNIVTQTSESATAWTAKTKDVTSAGTGEQLDSLTVPDGFGLVIKAKETNTDKIYIAPSKANSESAASRWTLITGSFRTLRINNANLVWVNSAVNGEGIEYSVEQI